METRKEEIDRLILGSLNGEITDAEKQILEEWIKEKEENKRYAEEISFLWDSSLLYQKTTEKDLEEDHKKLETIFRSAGTDSSGYSKRKSRSTFFGFLKIAAVFIVAFGLSWLAHSFLFSTGNDVAYNKVITTKGQKTRVILADGTIIWLNSESTLQYPANFDNRNREIILSGEAYFKVKKTDHHDPFVVKVPGLDIRVTGTSFNVKAYPEEKVIETTLIEGSVSLIRKVGDKYQTILLKPDQKATLVKKGANISIKDIHPDRPTFAHMEATPKKEIRSGEKIVISPDVNLESHIAWKNDQLIFERESFENIADQLERWFDVNIIFKDASLKKYCYTGKFVHKESLEQILRVIQLTTPFQYRFDKNQVIIYK